MLVLVTVSVPHELEKMTVNLKGPIVINSSNKKACQVIVEGEGYKVKFPIYDILQARKAGRIDVSFNRGKKERSPGSFNE